MSSLNSMFESIKDAMTKESTPRGQILRTEVGNTYTVRLIPNIKDHPKTFFHYYSCGWNSFATGQYMNFISPNTFGERDPISETKFKLLKLGNDEEKERAEKIMRKENWLVNVYVINDPVNPDNNGTIKVLRFGRQLHKIIMSAMQGDDAEEYGPHIFDVVNGCDFRIKVEKQGDYPTYVSSKFGIPKKIKNFDYENGVEGLYKDAYDLETFFQVKSTNELEQALQEHFFCVNNTTPAVEVKNSSTVVTEMVQTQKPVVEDTAGSDANSETDDEINALLDSLDDVKA